MELIVFCNRCKKRKEGTQWNGAHWCFDCLPNKEYGPYGAEWEREIMKHPKIVITTMLKNALKRGRL